MLGRVFPLVAVLAVGYLAYHYGSHKHKSKLPLPPGPPRDRIIGNIRSLPTSHAWVTFANWAMIYGSVIYLNLLGRSMVVLNTVDTARALLEKKGLNCSDRPTAIYNEMLGNGTTVIFLPYGDRWRRQRRAMVQLLTPSKVRQFHNVIDEKLALCLLKLRDHNEPGDIYKHVHIMIASVALKITYGHEVTSPDDKYVSLVDELTTRIVNISSAGSNIVDLIPVLRHTPSWFPGATFASYAAETHAIAVAARELPFTDVINDRNAGIIRSCFVTDLLNDFEKFREADLRIAKGSLAATIKTLEEERTEMEEDMRLVATTIYAAGVETTHSAIQSFLFIVSTKPDVQKQAQLELDSLLGDSRLPTVADKQKLPYVEAVMKEVLRWNPPAPNGIPHAAMKEDQIDGFLVPEKSVLVSNIWQILRDEDYFASPNTFLPERHLKGGDKRAKENDPTETVYGFGRRICPGRFLANDLIFVSIASILALYDLLPPVDPDSGKEIAEDIGPYSFTSGVTRYGRDEY